MGIEGQMEFNFNSAAELLAEKKAVLKEHDLYDTEKNLSMLTKRDDQWYMVDTVSTMTLKDYADMMESVLVDTPEEKKSQWYR